MASIKNTGATVYVGTSSADYFIDSGSGSQTMIGGLGDDFYFIDSVNDVIIENNGKAEGVDTVQTNTTGLGGYVLADNVENLILIASATGSYTGNLLDNKIDGSLAASVSLFGSAGNDTLLGSNSNNTLDGGVGKDVMEGGGGADVYYVDDAGDKIVEDTVSGSDYVYSSVSLVLSANVEGLYLEGAKALLGTGNAGNNYIYGNAYINTLTGLDGDDTLYGYAANDKLDGGNGNDRLFGGEDDDQLLGGAGNDTLQGENGNDKLDGGAGNDSLNGGNGNDQITGGIGDDSIRAGYGNDQILAGAGNDTLYGDYGSDKLDGGDGNDFIQDGNGFNTLLGGGGDDFIVTYSYSSQLLDAGAGNDILVAQLEQLGRTTLIGGAGDDTYYIQSAASASDLKVVEAANGGNDTVRLVTSNGTLASAVWAANKASFGATSAEEVAYTLSANVENLLADLSTGSKYLIGNALNNLIVGTSSNDMLSGGAGADTLDGNAGADNLLGGVGNDVYVVDDVSDTVYEENTAAGGVDTVLSSVTFRLANGLENLSLMGTSNINGLGNSVTNTIIGNAGKNLIDGGSGNDSLSGGAGADTIYGGLGNDTLDGGSGTDTLMGGQGTDIYYVDSASDVVIDTAGGASDDKIFSSSTYTLGNNANIEILELTADAGSASATGNADDVTIIGNDFNNTLSDGSSGVTGGGDDKLNGGKGDDTYYVAWNSSVKDQILDTAGTDTVYLSVADTQGALAAFNKFTLGTGELSGVDNLTITSSNAGFTGFNVTGSATANYIAGGNLADTIDGAAGDDTLYGGFDASADSLSGGLGNDALYAGGGADSLLGGAGNDTYYLDATYSVKVIEDAGAGIDTIYLDNTAVDLTSAALGNGNVENAVFAAATAHISVTGTAANNELQLISSSGVYTTAITGGAGNDTYILGNDTVAGVSIADASLVTISEAVGGGTDTLVSYVDSVTLANNIENLTLGTRTSGGVDYYAVTGIGNASDNNIIGNAGNNYLVGGAGNDNLTGGAGNDAYYVDNTADVVKELADLNSGYDSIYYTGLSGALTLAANVEYGFAYTAANVSIIGNALDNYISDSFYESLSASSFNSSGNNTLDGGVGNDYLYSEAGNDSLIGGLGNDSLNSFGGTDTLVGGAGDDVYYINSVQTITEALGGGADTLYYYGSTALTLADNVETLFFTDTTTGTLTGNILDNLIYIDTATAAAQTIDGGLGADTMAAGAGNDIYYVDNAKDVIVEKSGAGTDIIMLSGTGFNMGENAINVENLTLTSTDVANTNAVTLFGNSIGNTIDASLNTSDAIFVYAGGGADSVTAGTQGALLDGEEGADTLVGGVGADTLYGGLGADNLSGGSGNFVVDVFVFTDITGGVDTITDFTDGKDLLAFSQSVFDQLGDTIDVSEIGSFASGSGGTWAAGAYLALDTTNGKLYYDADTDTGSQFAKVQIATITGITTFDITDVTLLA